MLQTIGFLLRHPLNRSRPIATLRRWGAWQLSSRLRGGAREVPFVEDTVLVVERGMTGATGNIYCGLHEYAEMGLLLHVLRPGDVFVDVGANVGSYSVLAAGVCGAAVVAFEPVSRAYTALCRNITRNGISALVQARCEGVGRTSGPLLFTTDLDTCNHVVPASLAGDATISVGCTTLDAALAGRRPRLIKIDVEGLQHEVLEGAQAVLADDSLKALIVELSGGRVDDVMRMLHRHGFERTVYDPASRELHEGVGPGANQTFARDLPWLRDRLTDAPRVRIRATGALL